MALQVESEELHTAIFDICKELGLLRADFRREVGTLNGKVFDYDANRKRMCEAIERQERELAHREAGVEKITGSLEILMHQLCEGEVRQQQRHSTDQVSAYVYLCVCLSVCM